MKQVKLIIHGTVQGVFYRENTKNKALELNLKGYVKNLEDGTVEAVAQGSEEQINDLIQFCKNNPGNSNVTDIEITPQELQELTSFKITY